MRLTTNFLLLAVSLGAVQASWFGQDKKKEPEYHAWTSSELTDWLASRQVPIPTATPGPSLAELHSLVSAHWDSATSTASAWSAEQTQWAADQAGSAHQAFFDTYSKLKQDTFDTWDESRLREFLLEQGVVSPSGPREQLAMLAKQKWTQASGAAYAYSQSASSLAGDASQSASSLGSSASRAASTAIYGDSVHQASKSAVSLGTKASKSASSAVSGATETVAQTLDDSKDYIYSTWDDNSLRGYLESKGVLQPEQVASRNQLLQWMRDAYAAAANPIWEAWSDSYIHDWLLRHGIIRSGAQKKRDEYLSLMKEYYYGPQETIHSSWDDSHMKQWLVEHAIIKSDAQLKRQKLEKLLADNYANAQDTIWGAWDDSAMKAWLVEHGYIRSDAQKTHDELLKLMQDKYSEYNARTAPYLVWPDARLRAYLREHSLSEDALPTSRPGLLQEVRIRYVQTTGRAEALFGRVKDVINGGVEAAEDRLGKVLDVLTGSAEHARERTGEGMQEGGQRLKDAGAKVSKTEL
ncbi:hypothetical protein POSPLADRAFT_1060937 [Postia placenta MAD-698-R-SB12]|uniref:Meiotic sister chromatid recombination protein 1 n=1 Tax=Postia placenta MAD-698-R-SB12 TaxID=670580 RepID=A0A1X6MN68_9APHY|nr:hypothetical protein POSPLADRAFT_1060937 [Postia placenta MAD-698-R-SB12]OSX57867.1 hypothetical protein POSPLADRAFT_1060937 [Postia placenta MAD-698-R-SB12]